MGGLRAHETLGALQGRLALDAAAEVGIAVRRVAIAVGVVTTSGVAGAGRAAASTRVGLVEETDRVGLRRTAREERGQRACDGDRQRETDRGATPGRFSG